MKKYRKYNVDQYLRNKKLVNNYFSKLIYKLEHILQEKNIEVSRHSFNRELNIPTTIYIKNKYRISTHKKKNEAYNMENGILITMRNVKKNNINDDITKIMKYIKEG